MTFIFFFLIAASGIPVEYVHAHCLDDHNSLKKQYCILR